MTEKASHPLSNIVWPKNYTRGEVFELIDEIVGKLSHQFTFGYYDLDDIRQEGRIFALSALAKYDGEHSLKNFLYVHVRNRLINFVRDNYYRKNSPCSTCQKSFLAGGVGVAPTEHTDGKYCRKFLLWQKRNAFKLNVMKPIDIDNFNDDAPDCFYVQDDSKTNVEANEIYSMIEMKIPVGLRKYFLQLAAGQNISPYRKQQVVDKIKEILTDDEMERLGVWE